MAGLQCYLAFAEAARRGSFAAAARELGLSASTVAKAVARLEDDLGLRLFHRSTRQLSLTGEGREFHARCRRIVEELEALRDAAAEARAMPGGTLRLNLPDYLGRHFIVPALVRLVQRHPQLALDVSFSDRQVDIVREGYDAVVRIGPLRDSALVGRTIGAQTIIVCAAPAYLAAHGVPASPAELARHRCLVFRLPTTGRPRPWQLRRGRRVVEHLPEGRVVMDDGEALIETCMQGLGLLQVPGYMAAPAIARGDLVEVLAAFRPPPLPISLVYPAARRVVPRLRAFIDVLTEPDVARTLAMS